MHEPTKAVRRIVEQAYGRLKEMILYHQISPGQRLSDRDLAQALGVSRTPVREALSRLEQDGLVINLKAKGYSVRILDPQEVTDLYDVREMIECRAIRLAVKNAQPADLAEMRAILAELDKLARSSNGRPEEIKIGNRIHEIVGRGCGNRLLYQMIVRVLNQSLFAHWTEAWLETPAEVAATRREHRAYLTVLESRSVSQATRLVRTHVRRAKEQVLRVLNARQAFYAEGGPPSTKPIGSSSAVELLHPPRSKGE